MITLKAGPLRLKWKLVRLTVVAFSSGEDIFADSVEMRFSDWLRDTCQPR